MKKCDCGHMHCCHANTVANEVVDREWSRPQRFTRITCKDCKAWVADTNLEIL